MKKVTVKGIVQGVGFRPFVYRIAKEHGIKGYVKNAGNSVEILIANEDQSNFVRFLKDLKAKSPPLAKIYSIDVEDVEKEKEYKDFYVLKSSIEGSGESILPPDVAICEDCLREMFEKGRRYLYPFIVCMNCGPRFTIIESLPYDRENTTMKEFPMCEFCKEEYNNPMDRRFRAEPTCCWNCGPIYSLYHGREKIKLKPSEVVKKAAKLLAEGEVLAIKGIGGTHLASITTEDEPVLKIRRLRRRKYKPFAIMARDLQTIKTFAYVNEVEKKLLTSFRRPIVVLKKKDDVLSKHLAPGLHNIGVMLPYAGVHYLLFYYIDEPALVMTSANAPGEPMFIENEEIFTLSCYSLVHNRKIKNRCDDSVIKVIGGKPVFIRRSRGYVPEAIELGINNNENILALGAEEMVTACLLKSNKAFLSQHIGDTTKLKTLEFLEDAVYNLIRMNKVESIDKIAVDLHPYFNTSKLGERLASRFNCKLIKCQHHHAHIASVMAEHDIDKIIGIAMDGLGYGEDNIWWGGEILVCTHNHYERAGSLLPSLMPGGDLATRFPARAALGILSNVCSTEELEKIARKHLVNGFRNERELKLVLKQIARRFNSPLSTSTGRVLDAISALLNLCYERTYEGEPAIKLESFAFHGKSKLNFSIKIKKEDRYVIDTSHLLLQVLEAKEECKLEDIAASAQKALAEAFAEIAIKVAKEKKISTIGASGGVVYNEAIVDTIRRKIEKHGLKFLTNTKVPCGDGGISLGQVLIAAKRKNA